MAEELELKDSAQQPSDNGGYDKLVTLTPREHIRLRPGMYIGKLGDGSQSDDGIYVLIKEVMDNSIDEFNTGFAKQPSSALMWKMAASLSATMAVAFRSTK